MTPEQQIVVLSHALASIQQWAEAYPVEKLLPEPRRAAIEGVGRIAREALDEIEGIGAGGVL